jgi:predicted RNA-binding protein with PUA-like domain
MANSTGIRDIRYWLMKAEPESRIEKGKDVKVSRYLTTIVFLNYSGRSIISQFSVDDFEAVKTTPWEGVRNHEAKNLMKEMRTGDKVSKRSFPVSGNSQTAVNRLYSIIQIVNHQVLVYIKVTLFITYLITRKS